MVEYNDCNEKADDEDAWFACTFCDEKVYTEYVEFVCPYCGETDRGEGFYTCENCETLFDHGKDLWICEYCHNKGKEEDEEEKYCPECGELLEDPNFCYSCSWPNNQGWIGEHYG
ncbi:hypothetical protein [Methanobrevibacter sp. V74]|uniref:hypothetical protein n=1 Tax=Methanobrevibacter sp. V74 TaxID=3064279 RepID=UPI002736D399|nr:hypothetical protein [Methanobrevibacter sp. V74]